MNLSGFPDGRVAMLVYGVGTVSSSHSPHSGRRTSGSVLRAMALMVLAAICVSMRVSSVRPLSVDSRYKGKTTTRTAADGAAGGASEKNRLEVAARASTETRGRFSGRPRRAQSRSSYRAVHD